MLIVVMV